MRASIVAPRRSVLASLPIASGEAAGLTGIDLDEGNAGRAQGALEGAVIGAGRLEDHALDRRLGEPLHERLTPALVVGEATAHLAREALVKDRTAAKNRGKILTASLLKRHNAQRLEQIKRQITEIEAAILEQ